MLLLTLTLILTLMLTLTLTLTLSIRPWLSLRLVVNIGERLCLRLYLLTWRKNKNHAIVTHDNAPGTHQTAPQTVNKLQTSNLSN